MLIGRNHLIIKAAIGKNGLPIKNFVLCTTKCMIKWDCLTGEVSTIEYKNSSEFEQAVWYDELS